MAKTSKKTSKKAAKTSKKTTSMKAATTRKAATSSKKAAGTTRKAAATSSKKAATSSKKATSKRKPNPAFMRPWTPSESLAAVIGAAAVPRPQVVKKLWAYIKKHNLQDTKNRQTINADEKLQTLFGKKSFTMFEMNRFLKPHLK